MGNSIGRRFGQVQVFKIQDMGEKYVEIWLRSGSRILVSPEEARDIYKHLEWVQHPWEDQ